MDPSDNKYLIRCIDLAHRGQGQVAPNPLVGAVLVYDDRIIGQGWHKVYGGPHAEVEAITSVSQKNKSFIHKSCLYISLEPCNHQGLTPACTHLIISNRIPRVVIGTTDPNPHVAGGGIQSLRDAGIEVCLTHVQAPFNNLIRRFKINQLYQRPLIALKWAQSEKGYTGVRQKNIWFTNPYSKRLSHKWRHIYDAILVGKNTILSDKPALTNRLYFGRNPTRIILDPSLATLEAVSRMTNKNPLIIVNSLRDDTMEHITLIKHDFKRHTLLSLSQYLLTRFNIYSILVEGGRFTIQQFIDQKLWDTIYIFKTPTSIQAGQLPKAISAPIFKGQIIHKMSLDQDRLEIYQP